MMVMVLSLFFMGAVVVMVLTSILGLFGVGVVFIMAVAVFIMAVAVFIMAVIIHIVVLIIVFSMVISIVMSYFGLPYHISIPKLSVE